MVGDLPIELVTENDDILELSGERALIDTAVVPDLRFLQKVKRERCTSLAGPASVSVPKKILAPKIRSKAPTRRLYSLPPFCIPKVSNIAAPLRKRTNWLRC